MKTVLYYVDNDSDDLSLFLYAANSLNFDVKLFKKGEQVVATLKQCNEIPTVVFVDLQMPLISGEEVIAELRKVECLQKVPIIAISTATDDLTIA